MRDVATMPRPRRLYGTDRSGGQCVVYADPADPSSGRVWPKALPPHRSPCRIDAGKGLAQHRCSGTHASVVEGYRAWRDSEYAMAEDATHGYATELSDYWRDRPRPTFTTYLLGTGRDRNTDTDTEENAP